MDTDQPLEDEEKKIVKNVVVPHIARPPATNVYLAKMPKFLHVEPMPFDPQTSQEFLAAKDPDADPDELEMGRIRGENTIRWRYTGNLEKESNARLLKWSDGSHSLLLGDELFGVSFKDMGQDHQYLAFIHASELALLQTQSRFTQMMMFAPSSTNSAIHKKLTAGIRNRHQKATRTKLFAKMQDPTLLRKEAEAREREILKSERKLRSERSKAEGEYRRERRTRYSDEEEERPRRYRDEYADEDEEEGILDDFDDDMSGDEEADRQRAEKLQAAKRSSEPKRSRSTEDLDVAIAEATRPAAAVEEEKKVVYKRRIIDSDDED
ncbi:hypothetical protein HK101_004357 [Irineochytrium annulatum]|nr:hypothetical protein HK101_004357 [Irineochytrium annulatum]